MNFTRISASARAWKNIITEDMNTATKPVFYQVNRFNIYRLKILKQTCTDGQLIAFLIAGDEKRSERSLLFLEIHYGLVIKYVFQTGKRFDAEQTRYLGFALMMYLRKKGIYRFSSGLEPFKRSRC